MTDSALLRIDGVDYGGWTSFTVERSIEQAAGSFQLAVTERWPGQPSAWAIGGGAACTLLLDGEPAITGYVDQVERGFEKEATHVDVIGRDRTADVVDCCADPGEFTDLTLDRLARRLVAPYDIDVLVTPGTDVGAPFHRWAVEPGERIWESLERAARQRALLMITDGNGRILITRAGHNDQGAALVEGENVVGASYRDDVAQRYHIYKGLGQSGDERWSEAAGNAHQEAEITDPQIRAPRRLVFTAEDNADGVSMRQRTEWERNVRRGRGQTATVKVQGFSAVPGQLWQPNLMVPVRLPSLGLSTRMLIVSVKYSLTTEAGRETTLTLSPRDAWDLLPERDDAAGDTPWGGL